MRKFVASWLSRSQISRADWPGHRWTSSRASISERGAGRRSTSGTQPAAAIKDLSRSQDLFNDLHLRLVKIEQTTNRQTFFSSLLSVRSSLSVNRFFYVNDFRCMR